MTSKRPISLLAGAVALPLTALAIAACGGGGGNATASQAPANSDNRGAATVGVANTGLGKVLVDSRGRTLYLFKKDTGTRSMCSGECAMDWPPLLAKGKPSVAGGASAAQVGTSARSDGGRQVTYNGHPLYRFSGDHKPGDTAGQGLVEFGAAWYAVTPAGNQASSSGGGASTGTSGSY